MNREYRAGQGSQGFYTIEAAFALTIFTALFMMLLSLLTVIRVETVLQSAINQTAMQLSQYSYAVTSMSDNFSYEFGQEESNQITGEDKIPVALYQILSDADREIVGHLQGASLCKTLTRSNIEIPDCDKWLEAQGVDNGFSGLDFSVSNVLGDGENIEVTVIYKLNLNSFGFSNRCLTICQRAVTKAWLPVNADFRFEEDESKTSIWQETSFVRGKFFVAKFKSDEPKAAVKSGQGIDLYYKTARVIVEIVSMNVFAPSYSVCTVKDEALINNVTSYTPNSEAIEKQLLKYAKEFNNDIAATERLIEMEDGSLGNFGKLNEKRLILIVPIEAKENKEFTQLFFKLGEKLLMEKGVRLQVKYMEEALL